MRTSDLLDVLEQMQEFSAAPRENDPLEAEIVARLLAAVTDAGHFELSRRAHDGDMEAAAALQTLNLVPLPTTSGIPSHRVN